MYVIREVMQCKPGKVRPLMEKFKQLSAAVEDLGQPALRLLTDVSGERFWTLVIEIQVQKIDDFFAMEQALMAKEAVGKAMAGYHDLVAHGRREVYRVET
jgi:hypothetical protein